MKYLISKSIIVLILLISNVLYAQHDPSGIDKMLESLVKFLGSLFILVLVGTILIVFYLKKRKTVRENQELHESPDSILIEQLPNSTLILIFGILSILASCFIIIGLPLGIVALILAYKATKLNAKNPDGYTGIQNVRIGKVLALIGIIFNVFYAIKFMFPILL